MLDVTTRERETELIVRFVELAARDLPANRGSSSRIAIGDVGCGNGFTLGTLRRRFPLFALHGFEFTPQLLALAQARFADDEAVSVVAGDVRQLQAPNDAFDVLVCQRVLINLLDGADQRRALGELARVLRPDGLLLSIEAFNGPLVNLNAARGEFGLEPIPAAYHNLYLEDDFFAEETRLAPLHDESLPANFLSSYYYIARVLQPALLGNSQIRNSLFARFLSAAIDRPIGDYSPIRAHAFRKR
jgi:ubiquinone/menaquinone biosynthesis C-methylase UbiE